jgi:hypothetical protein
MADILLSALTVAFFIATIGLISLCERVRGN